MDEHDRRTGYGLAATKTSRFFAFSRLRARQEIRCTFCCWPPGPLARRERRAYPVRYVRSEQHRQRACGPQPGGARGRAGICFVAAPRRCTPASPASRRLASARPALAPKCTPYFLTGPKGVFFMAGSFLSRINPFPCLIVTFLSKLVSQAVSSLLPGAKPI